MFSSLKRPLISPYFGVRPPVSDTPSVGENARARAQGLMSSSLFHTTLVTSRRDMAGDIPSGNQPHGWLENPIIGMEVSIGKSLIIDPFSIAMLITGG